MSTQPAPALAPQPEPQPPAKEIPELTDAYRKAHKSYVLASGLLASWELIGITLQTKEKWGIELKSPTAVPLILFVLVIYSGYKMTIEWLQCNSERRKNLPAKWDYRIAHGIALSAIGISVVQYLLSIQIVDVLARHAWSTGIGLTVLCGLLARLAYSLGPIHLKLFRAAAITASLALGLGVATLQDRHYKTSIASFSTLTLAAIVCLYLVYSHRNKTKPRPA